MYEERGLVGGWEVADERKDNIKEVIFLEILVKKQSIK